VIRRFTGDRPVTFGGTRPWIRPCTGRIRVWAGCGLVGCRSFHLCRRHCDPIGRPVLDTRIHRIAWHGLFSPS